MRISWSGMDGWTALWVALATAFYFNMIYHTNTNTFYISPVESALLFRLVGYISADVSRYQKCMDSISSFKFLEYSSIKLNIYKTSKWGIYNIITNTAPQAQHSPYQKSQSNPPQSPPPTPSGNSSRRDLSISSSSRVKCQQTRLALASPR